MKFTMSLDVNLDITKNNESQALSYNIVYTWILEHLALLDLEFEKSHFTNWITACGAECSLVMIGTPVLHVPAKMKKKHHYEFP